MKLLKFLSASLFILTALNIVILFTNNDLSQLQLEQQFLLNLLPLTGFGMAFLYAGKKMNSQSLKTA